MLTRLVTVLLAFVPGGLLGFAVRPGRERYAAWACAPILSLGLTSFGVAWLPRLGLPNGTTAVLVTELVLVAFGVLLARLAAARVPGSARVDPSWWRPWPGSGSPTGSRTGSRTGSPTGSRPRLPGRDLAAVAVPAVLALGFGREMLGQFRFPIGWDSMNHAVLTGNIVQTGSTAIGDACSTGSTLRAVACNFYPIAVDVSWAQAANLSGGPISVAMTTWSMVVGPLALVAAVYATVRVMGAGRVVAACASAAPLVVGSLWEQQLAGRVTGAIPAFGTMIALLIALAVKGRQPLRLGLLAGLGSAGLLMTHTYDAFFAATLALAVMVLLRGRFRVRQTLVALVAAGLAAIIVVAPLLGDLAGASANRPNEKPMFAGHLGPAVRYWVTDLRRYTLFGYPVPGSVNPLPHLWTVHVAVGLTVLCLLASPLCLVIPRLRWGRPWLVVWALWTLIGIWTTVSTSRPAASLAHSWYGEPQRLRDMIFPVYPILAVAGACAIGTGVQLLASRLRSGSAAAAVRVLPAAVAVLLVAPLITLAAVPATGRQLRGAFGRQTPRSAAYPRVFAWLAARTPKTDVVAWNRNVEFFPWAFADYGVSPLYGIPTLLESTVPNERQRYQAWDWLVLNDFNRGGQFGCAVRALRIKYVVVSRTHVPGQPKGQLVHSGIAQSPNVQLVHTDGPIQVYEVTAKGRACPGSP